MTLTTKLIRSKIIKYMFFSKLILELIWYIDLRVEYRYWSQGPYSQASMSQSNPNLEFEVVKIEFEPKPGFVKREVFKNVWDIIN